MPSYSASEYRSRKMTKLLELFRCPSCFKYFDESERIKVTNQKHRCKTCVENARNQTRINIIRKAAEKVQS